MFSKAVRGVQAGIYKYSQSSVRKTEYPLPECQTNSGHSHLQRGGPLMVIREHGLLLEGNTRKAKFLVLWPLRNFPILPENVSVDLPT